MKEQTIQVNDGRGGTADVPLMWVHTLVVGSGAAGLNAAVQLRTQGVEDVMILTEGLQMGTSINTGSDKQTYYKLNMCGEDADSPVTMARTFFDGGSMHGDLALVEASLSARAFIHLVNLGVPFPRDRFGQFVGYKTDHDPRQRATSIGPYTSREMCRALIRRAKELRIPIREKRVVVQLLTLPADGAGAAAGEGPAAKRVAGALVMRQSGALEAYGCENLVFAAGGPGGLYKSSVYPQVHTGAIGLGLMAGAQAQSLPESQYGLASIGFRWNVSGTYMQVIPRFISTDADGKGEAREFMREYFDTVGQMNSQVFLKGYQWPFDSRKAIGGSSIVDILVYIETVLRGRRVFLDFRGNPDGFRFEDLSDEARNYLVKSESLFGTPIERLRKMNPGAIDLYRDHGIDITSEPLEIAVCAQHNNGGLAGNLWWESLNVKHLFPVGEVNGSHGVYRPGGSALNSGQVGSLRAAEFIANRYKDWTVQQEAVTAETRRAAAALLTWVGTRESRARSWRKEREEFQGRMSKAGAHIRSSEVLPDAVQEAWAQYRRLESTGGGGARGAALAERIRNLQLCFAHAVYLESVLHALQSGVGSRGSAIVLNPAGKPVHDKLDATWRITPENPEFRDKVQETWVEADGQVRHRWTARRPMPVSDAWFETAWARFRSGEVYS